MKPRHVFVTLIVLSELTIGAALMTTWPATGHGYEHALDLWLRSRALPLRAGLRRVLRAPLQRGKGKRRPPGFGGPAWGW